MFTAEAARKPRALLSLRGNWPFGLGESRDFLTTSPIQAL